ncbi:MAG: sulfatase-like hydrolase/transferase, partial [Acutalibacteraceae bacterium]
MKKNIEFDNGKKVFPIITCVIGAVIMILQLITRQNLIAVVSAGYCCILSAIILISLIAKKKVYLTMILGYAFSSLGTVLFHVIWGADAGFGALTSGKAGFSSAEHTLMTGDGNLFTRILGNLIIVLPTAIALWGLLLVAKKAFKSGALKKVFSAVLSVLLVGSSIFYVLTMNMRTKPVTERMWEGHDDYLKGVDKNTENKPNVLVILMDDLGYGDISLNGAIYDTPNIDSIGKNGLNFENFYSSYSVCSPARFAALTGRYPYRGYADNVIYP